MARLLPVAGYLGGEHLLEGEIFWRIGPFPLYTLGLSLAVGFLSATIVAIPHMRRGGFRRRQVLQLMLAVMLFSVLGARVAALLFGWGTEKLSLLSLFVIPPEGLSYYGGLVTACIVVIVHCYRSEWGLLTVTDTLVPATALGMTVGMSVQLAANLIHLKAGGTPWVNLVLFTASYGTTWYLWRNPESTRFRGELTLLFLGAESLLRLVAGRFWAYGEAPPASARGPLITLAIVVLLWFLFRGAAERRSDIRAVGENDGPVRLGKAAPGWIGGYVLLASVILTRLYAGTV